MTDEEIRRRLQRAADELLVRHGEGCGRARLPWLPSGVRLVAVGVPVLAVLLAIGMLAFQFVGTQQPGSLFDPGASESPASTLVATPSSSPMPTPTRPASPHPSIPPSPTTSPTPAVMPPPTVGGPACHPAPRTSAPEGIEVTIEASKDSVARDGSIRFTVRMRNNGLEPVSNDHSSQEYDILVRGGDGRWWLWSHDRAFTQPLIYDTYPPGEERSGTESWDVQPNCGGAPSELSPGTYEAIGMWLTFNGSSTEAWWSEPISFEVR